MVTAMIRSSVARTARMASRPARVAASPVVPSPVLRMSSVATCFANDKAVDALIKSDHQKVEGLFQQYEQTPAGDEKLRIAHQVIRELSVHAAREEVVVYPEVAKREGQEVADHAREEHQSMKELLAKLDTFNNGWEPEVDALLKQVIKETREHVKEEENEVLPKLAAAVGPDKMDSMGKEFEAAKAGAPTRPHPAAPNKPPLNALNAGAVPVDLARDAARFGVEETGKYVQGKDG